MKRRMVTEVGPIDFSHDEWRRSELRVSTAHRVLQPDRTLSDPSSYITTIVLYYSLFLYNNNILLL